MGNLFVVTHKEQISNLCSVVGIRCGHSNLISNLCSVVGIRCGHSNLICGYYCLSCASVADGGRVVPMEQSCGALGLQEVPLQVPQPKE
jgi:hypothetical protein